MGEAQNAVAGGKREVVCGRKAGRQVEDVKTGSAVVYGRGKEGVQCRQCVQSRQVKKAKRRGKGKADVAVPLHPIN